MYTSWRLVLLTLPRKAMSSGIDLCKFETYVCVQFAMYY